MLMRDRAPNRSLALSNRVAFFGSPGFGIDDSTLQAACLGCFLARAASLRDEAGSR
jgi:hypothetical protein